MSQQRPTSKPDNRIEVNIGSHDGTVKESRVEFDSVIGGDVNVEHGDFVGRDKHEHYHGQQFPDRPTMKRGQVNLCG